jgi:hypothetical protein
MQVRVAASGTGSGTERRRAMVFPFGARHFARNIAAGALKG